MLSAFPRPRLDAQVVDVHAAGIEQTPAFALGFHHAGAEHDLKDIHSRFELLAGDGGSWDGGEYIAKGPFADAADVLVIAPATANVMAKLAHGIADDALTCIALALNPKAKILIAPAMNGKMWLHPATQENVKILKSRGAEFIGPDEGMLSCGYEGIGRLWPVEKIAERVLKLK